MTKEMKYLMHLYACAAKSVSAASPEEPVDFEVLYALADKMSLLTMLSYALKISPNVPCPDNIKSKLYTLMLGTSLKNKMRMDAVLGLLGDIEKSGVKAVVLKGLDCGRYYAKPECRISADTDLLIEETDEEKLLAYFEQKGYSIRRREGQQHHSECVCPQTGMLEVHTKMCEDDVFEAMSKKVKPIDGGAKNSNIVSVSGREIRVLNPTDAMMFMTLHLVKHFMFGRAGLKMSYDMALYYTNNAHLVDKKKFTRWLSESGFETILSALFSAMVLYCGFSKEDFENLLPYNEEKGKAFADHLEGYNSSEENPLDYLTMLQYYTTQSNIAKKGKAYAFFKNAKVVIGQKSRLLFPKLSHLKKSYPYLQKHPYLYLLACTHRFFKRGRKHMFHGDPQNGKVFGYRENLSRLLSVEEEKQIESLKDMGLL